MTESLHYTIRRSRRARQARIRVSCDAVVVTAPYRLPLHMVEKWVSAKMPWIVEAKERLAHRQEGRVLLRSRFDYFRYRHRALQFVRAKVQQWNQTLGCPVTSVTVRNQKTRWGSCSSGGVLSFHYLLLFLPEQIADYVIVHELCHTREMNHSLAFWTLVGSALPDYQARRDTLKTFRLE